MNAAKSSSHLAAGANVYFCDFNVSGVKYLCQFRSDFKHATFEFLH